MKSLRPTVTITYEIKGFQQTIAILPDRSRTYKVVDKADTACWLVNHGLPTYVAARAWVSSYLFMQYDVIVEEIDIDWIETTTPITKAAKKARKIGNLHYRYRYVYMTTPFPVMQWALTAMHYILWNAHLSDFSFKPRVKS